MDLDDLEITEKCNLGVNIVALFLAKGLFSHPPTPLTEYEGDPRKS